MNSFKKLKRKIIEINDSDFSEKLQIMQSFKEIFNNKNNYNKKIKLYNNPSVLRHLSLKFGYFFEYWFYPEFLTKKSKKYLLRQIFYDATKMNAYPSGYEYFLKNKIYDINKKIIYIFIILYIKDIKNWISYTNEEKLKRILSNEDIIKHLIKNYIEYIKDWSIYVDTNKLNQILSNEDIIKHLIKNHIDKIDIWKKFINIDLKKFFSRKIGRYLMENEIKYIDKFLPFFRKNVFRKSIPFTVYQAIRKGYIEEIKEKEFEYIWNKYPEKREYYIKLIEKFTQMDLTDYKDSMNLIENLKK